METTKIIKVVHFEKMKVPDKQCKKCNGTGKQKTFFGTKKCSCVTTAFLGKVSYVPIGGKQTCPV